MIFVNHALSGHIPWSCHRVVDFLKSAGSSPQCYGFYPTSSRLCWVTFLFLRGWWNRFSNSGLEILFCLSDVVGTLAEVIIADSKLKLGIGGIYRGSNIFQTEPGPERIVCRDAETPVYARGNGNDASKKKN